MVAITNYTLPMPEFLSYAHSEYLHQSTEDQKYSFYDRLLWGLASELQAERHGASKFRIASICKSSPFITIWFVEFNSEVALSFYINREQLIIAAHGRPVLATILHDNFRTFVLNPCDQKTLHCDTTLQFQGSSSFLMPI